MSPVGTVSFPPVNPSRAASFTACAKSQHISRARIKRPGRELSVVDLGSQERPWAKFRSKISSAAAKSAYAACLHHGDALARQSSIAGLPGATAPSRQPVLWHRVPVLTGKSEPDELAMARKAPPGTWVVTNRVGPVRPTGYLNWLAFAEGRQDRPGSAG